MKPPRTSPRYMGSWGLNLDSTDVNSWTCERINEGYVDGLQLPEPELDVVQAASTNPLEPEPKLDGDHLPESELNGVQASGGRLSITLQAGWMQASSRRAMLLEALKEIQLEHATIKHDRQWLHGHPTCDLNPGDIIELLYNYDLC
ncbi:hypothetical protein BDA96_01G172100 [Sorghum bicolor]|uniref:Uncharacterized protein n=2 Tax=Sorghum bicolor TaxID=4558 RepID=A0A921UXZ1_SORBI|nr:hypothetical protein BDA96_01G172100 [Sorghum bicolor]KXG37991.1 hypothetical protein SORBI_3001G163900 [Sorghum bicolor]